MPGFLDLPPELRSVIYIYALVPHGKVYIYHPKPGTTRLSAYSTPKPVKRERPILTPMAEVQLRQALPVALLAICKQVHDEALPILYGSLEFSLSGGDLAEWFQQIGARASTQIRNLTLSDWPINVRKGMLDHLLSSTPNLRRVTLQGHGFLDPKGTFARFLTWALAWNKSIEGTDKESALDVLRWEEPSAAISHHCGWSAEEYEREVRDWLVTELQLERKLRER